jgi:hypothetical protein
MAIIRAFRRESLGSEVLLIGERTRDKMSAARKKGKWAGGCPVLGYDVDPGGGRLVVNEEEAERVRAIFGLFAEHGSVQQTLAEIERRGWRLKSWTRKTGEFRSGGLFTLSALRRLLTNILYTGEVRHQGHIYAGEQADVQRHARDLQCHPEEGWLEHPQCFLVHLRDWWLSPVPVTDGSESSSTDGALTRAVAGAQFDAAHRKVPASYVSELSGTPRVRRRI